MRLLDPWRRELRALIPRGFLRLCRGDGLFVSDVNRQCDAWQPAAQKMKEQDFEPEVAADGLLRIGVNTEKLRALWDTLAEENKEICGDHPLRELAVRLERHGAPLADQPREILYRIMKDLDGGAFETLDTWLRPCLSERQRKHLPLPSAGGKMILWALCHEEGENGGC